MSWRLLIVIPLFLVACAVQPPSVIAPAAKDRGDLLPVFVGTTRAVDRLGRPSRKTDSAPLSFANHLVAYPQSRETGDVPMARGVPNPQEKFAVADIKPYTGEASFARDLKASLRERPAGKRTVLVYVHGFNVTFSEGLYRTAQIVRDWRIDHIPAYFSWPSTLSPINYAHDQKASLQARQEFRRFLEAIVDAGAEGIVLLGHSLGAELVLETLVAMQTTQDTRMQQSIDGVFLAAPDMSVDRFTALAGSISALPDPFVVFSSSKDWALRLSSLRHGEPERLGALTDPGPLAGLNVLLVDLSGYREGYVNHRVAFSSPRLLAERDEWTSRSDQVGRALRVLTGE